MNIPFLGSKKDPILGIDIGSATVKVVELGKSGGKLQLLASNIQPLPADIVSEGKINDAAALAVVLRKAVAMTGSKAKNVAVAVPGASVITRIIDMPASLNDEELETQLLMEAEQYIPYSLDEVAVDFAVVEKSEDNEEQVKVMLAACRKETIDGLSEVLELAELKPKIIDVEPFCIERVYPLISEQLEEDADSLIAMVDVGAVNLRVNILDHGKTVYSREEMFGAKQLIEEVQRRYGLSYEEAVAAENEGSLPKDYDVEVLQPFRENLVQQISRAMQFFFSSTHYNHIDCVILAGGIAAQTELVDLAEQKLEIPVLAANPFSAVSIKSKSGANIKKNAPSLLVATGLALRGVE